MFTAKLYNKTGFNLVNIPDTPALLATAAASVKTVPAMDILQLYFNPVITIKAFENDVMYADYLELIGDFDGTNKSAYYFIESYRMTSGDTIELNVSMEPWLTAGGLDKVQFLDGITNRHHVGYNDDVFGAYQEDDDIFVPSQPVEIVEEDRLFDPTSTAAYKTGSGYALVVLSSTDLNNAENYKYDVWATSSDESAGKKGTMNFGGTFAEWMGGDRYNSEALLSTHRSFTGNPFVVTCGLDDTAVNNIMSKLCNIYANGAGSVVNYMYLIPLQYATYLQNGVNNRMQNTIDFADISFKLPNSREGSTGIKNIRVYGGPENSEIFLSTASGVVKEIRIDQLALNEETEGNYIKYTTSIGAFADVRPGGGITYTFSEKTTPTSFMEGGKWMEMPSSVTSADGINQARAKFEANRTLQNMENYSDIQYSVDPGSNRLIPALSGLNLKNDFDKFKTNRLQKRYGLRNEDDQAAMDVLDINSATLMSGIVAGDEKSKTAYSRQLQLQSEMKQFNAGVVLNGHVTGDMKSIPDTSCHELIHYSKRLSGVDMTRFDAILTRYGYKHTQILKKGGSSSTDILKNRQNYNYIQTKGVSVLCDSVPKSVRDGVCDAFNTGVRIWHVKPTYAALITNPYATGGN